MPSISDLTVLLACSLGMTEHESQTRHENAGRKARKRRIHSSQPPRPPLPTWRWRPPRRRRGLLLLLVRSLTSLPNCSIRLSSSAPTPPWPPLRRNRLNPPGSCRCRRRRSSSNSRRRRVSGGLATPVSRSSIRCRSSASTSSPTCTASTYVSIPSSSPLCVLIINPSNSA